MTPNTASPSATMLAGRQTDSARRRRRVLTALGDAVSHGAEITVSGIARTAGVDRSFLYRHHDLLEQIHTAQAQSADTGTAATVSRASLQADLLASQQRCARAAARTQHLERRLSELLGEQAWRESGLGAPDDIDQLNQRITRLEQQIVDLRLQLDERDQDLQAARAANRELMTQLNATQK